MKTRYFLYLTIAVAALASCKEKDPEVPGPGPESSGIKVTIPTTGPLSLYSWDAYDEFRIGDKTFQIKEGAGTNVAVFNGTPDKDNYYMIAYPSDITGVDRYLSYNFEGQYQKGNDSKGHLIPTVLIEDANTCQDITLSKEWAESKGGSFRCNGVISFSLNLPADMGEISELKLEAVGKDLPVNNDGTRTTKAYSLNFMDTRLSTEGVLKAYLSVPEKKFTANEIKITVFGDNASYRVSLVGEFETGGGRLEEVNILSPESWTLNTGTNGDGTEASPYILMTPYDVEHMSELMEEGKTTWFELGDDIDMQDVKSWTPLNISTPYNMAIHFDGNSHRISNFTCESDDYPSFFGVLNGTVKDVTFYNATITGAGKAGVIAGYLGTNLGDKTNPDYISATVINVKVENATVTGKSYAGGIAGQIGAPGTFENLYSKNATVSSTNERAGGLIGQVGYADPLIGVTLVDCNAEDANVKAPKNVGGLIGVCYASVEGCTASGYVTATAANDKEVSVGGLIGHLESGNATNCWCNTKVELTLKGRSIGGFVGTFKAGIIEKCYAAGEVIGTYRNNGGFVGLIQANAGAPSSKPATIRNCYSTGNVSANSHAGGFLGLIDNPTDKDTGAEVTGTVTISNCYCTGNVTGTGFGIGGFVGYQGCPKFQADHCAAWANKVTASTIQVENWSSGAFSAVTYPKCVLTDNYRNPAMVVTAWWVPDADYQHPNVSASSPLIVKDKTSGELITSPSGTLSGGNFPQLAYHGKVEAGKTLSQLASTTLNWPSDIWYFGSEFPALK